MPWSMYQAWRCWHQYSYQLLALVRRHEVLHLHLLELTGAEHEVAGRDLVAERLADLGDAEGRLLPRGLEHVLEVEEHALRRLGPQVHLVPGALHRAGVGLEHEVELPSLGEGAVLPAARAGVRVVELVEPEPLLALLQSTSGSVKFARWPDASHTAGGLRIDASMPTTSSRSCTIDRHQAFFTLRSISTPRGP